MKPALRRHWPRTLAYLRRSAARSGVRLTEDGSIERDSDPALVRLIARLQRPRPR